MGNVDCMNDVVSWREDSVRLSAARLAQLVEHRTCNSKAAASYPAARRAFFEVSNVLW